MQIMNVLKLSKNCMNAVRLSLKFQKASYSNACDLKGRDLVSFESYTTNEVHTLLWIALDIKERKPELKLCAGKSICMISDDPIRRLSLSNAATRLGASTAFVSAADLPKESFNMELFGKTLASAADIVLIDSEKFNQEEAEKLAAGCTVPVINVRSSELAPVLCLGELMSIHEHYKYLRRLVISYVGIGSDPILNTYAVLLPKVGMHLHFLINDEMKGPWWEKGVKLSAQSSTEFRQFDNLADNLFRAHIISTCAQNIQDFQLSLKDTKEMDLDWTLLHSDVYKGCSISEDMIRCKQSLIWDAIANLTWIFQAIIVAKTASYKPFIQRPEFEGVP